MTEFGHIHRITRQVGGKVITFRCKLEYKWAVYCQFRKEQGIILDWWYEDLESLLELKTGYLKNRKLYLPDFVVKELDESHEIEETKGYFPPKDATKLRLAAEQYENPITLIFASKPYKAQLRRAERLEPHIKRIIWDANKTIFKPISGLFGL